MLKELHFPKIDVSRILPHIIELTLVVSASLILVWVSWLTWIDITEWGKDLGSIFLGSRAGEPISLGVGMTVMNYFLIGLSLLAVGTALFLRERIFLAMNPRHATLRELQNLNVENGEKSAYRTEFRVNKGKAAAGEQRLLFGCPYHFGYLSSRPNDSEVPQECMICPRLGDCMVATVYVKKLSK